MSNLPSIQPWYKCIFRMCDYYRLYLKVIVPGRLTHNEYHRVMQQALEHIVDCPLCAAKEPCEAYAKWQEVWKLE